jgi:GNAT superfamily N-acetyltransferase
VKPSNNNNNNKRRNLKVHHGDQLHLHLLTLSGRTLDHTLIYICRKTFPWSLLSSAVTINFFQHLGLPMTNSTVPAVSWRDNCGAVTLHLDKVKTPRPPDIMAGTPQQQAARVSCATAQDMKTVVRQREQLAEAQEEVLIGTKQQRLAGATSLPRERILVARGRDRQPTASSVQGHARWEPCVERGRALLSAIFVADQCRRDGVGRALLAAVEAQALAHGFAFIQAKIPLANVQAGVFFQCSGFALVRNDRDGTLTYEKALQ